MAEGVDAIAVDVRDGAGRAHFEVAADQRHADRVALAQRPTAGGEVCSATQPMRR